ncbi:MAG: DinB family protein [Alicyclobacillus sp.]|nr:DinB family protein [Alicyclobacillus sp.]
MSRMAEYQAEAHRLLDELRAFARDLPEAVVDFRPAADRWTVREIAAHVEEAMVYWAHEFAASARQPDRKWGRTLQDEQRLQAVAGAPQRTWQDIQNGLVRAQQTLQQTFQQFDDSALDVQAPAANPKFGVKPLSFLVDHFIVEHLQGHLQQMKRNAEIFREQA